MVPVLQETEAHKGRAAWRGRQWGALPPGPGPSSGSAWRWSARSRDAGAAGPPVDPTPTPARGLGCREFEPLEA